MGPYRVAADSGVHLISSVVERPDPLQLRRLPHAALWHGTPAGLLWPSESYRGRGENRALCPWETQHETCHEERKGQ
jgi:hypothetical protein